MYIQFMVDSYIGLEQKLEINSFWRHIIQWKKNVNIPVSSYVHCTVASLTLHHVVFSFAGIFCNEAYNKKGVFWHGVKQIWDTNQNQQAWKELCWKNHWILPKKAKPLFFKLIFKQVKPLWKSKNVTDRLQLTQILILQGFL